MPCCYLPGLILFPSQLGGPSQPVICADNPRQSAGLVEQNCHFHTSPDNVQYTPIYMGCGLHFAVFHCGLVLDNFTHIIQGYFTGTGIIWRPRRQWNNPEECGDSEPLNG